MSQYPPGPPAGPPQGHGTPQWPGQGQPGAQGQPQAPGEHWTSPLPPPAAGRRHRGLIAGAAATALALVGGIVAFSVTRGDHDGAQSAGGSASAPSSSAPSAAPGSSSSSASPSSTASSPSSASSTSPAPGSGAGTTLNRPNYFVSVPLPAGWVRAGENDVYGFEVVKKGSMKPSKLAAVRHGAYFGKNACRSGKIPSNLADFGFTNQGLRKNTTYASRTILTKWLDVAATQQDGSRWPTSMGATTQVKLPNNKVGSKTTGYVTLRKHSACEGKRTRITVMTYAIGNRGSSMVVSSHDGVPGGLTPAAEDKLLRSVRPHM